MRDLDDLVRTTLTDPRRELPSTSAQLAAYRDRSRAIRRRRSTISAVAVAATVAVVATAATTLHGSGTPRPGGTATSTPTSAAPSPSATNSVPTEQLISEVVPVVHDAVAAQFSSAAVPSCATCSQTLYVLDSSGKLHLVTLGHAGAQPSLGRATPADGWSPIADVASGLTLQDVGPTVADVQVWSWSNSGSASTLREYDIGTLRVTRTLQVPYSVFTAVAVDGSLWLASSKGVYRLASGAAAPTRLSPHGSFALTVRRGFTATDVYVTEDPYVVRYDPVTASATARVDVKLGKTSLALTRDPSSGQDELWVAGYAMFGAVDHRIVHLDPDTLAVKGSSAVDAQIGPGAGVFGGDAGVVWVDTDGNTACINAATGEVLAISPGRAPVQTALGVGWNVEGSYLNKITPPAACIRS